MEDEIVKILNEWNEYKVKYLLDSDNPDYNWDGKIFEIINKLLPLVDDSCLVTRVIRTLLQESRHGWIDATGSAIYLSGLKIEGRKWTNDYKCASSYCLSVDRDSGWS